MTHGVDISISDTHLHISHVCNTYDLYYLMALAVRSFWISAWTNGRMRILEKLLLVKKIIARCYARHIWWWWKSNSLFNKIFDPVLREVSSSSLHLFRVELNWLYVKA